MSKADNIEERVHNIVCEQLGTTRDKITAETSFINDLGADSLDTVELVMEFVLADLVTDTFEPQGQLAPLLQFLSVKLKSHLLDKPQGYTIYELCDSVKQKVDVTLQKTSFIV